MSTVKMPTPYFKPVVPVHQRNKMAPVSGSYPVFSARRKTEQVDWRKIAALNIDQMAQAFDFNTLQENIYSITFCDIESELDMRLVDPNYIKLFKLSQLTIEYLLNSQEYLTHQLGSLEETMKQYQQNVEDTKAQCDKLQKDMVKIAKESHKRKKLLMAQQQLIHGVPGNYHKCIYCTKAFLHQSYLQKHISKRHADVAEPTTNTPVEDGDVSSGHGSGSRSSIPATNVISALEKQLKAMKDDLMIMQERELQKEAELKGLKNLFEERDNQYEADLVDLRRKLIKQSNLGSIRDDDDDDDEIRAVVPEKDVESVLVEKKVKSKISEPLLEKKVQSLEKKFDMQFKKQEKKWLTEMENMKKKYQQEIILVQQKQQKAAVIPPSDLAAKPAKRKLTYSQKSVKINEPKINATKKENKTTEVSLISHVMPLEKSEYSDDEDDETEEETEEEEDEIDANERKEDEVKEISLVNHSMENTMSTTGSLTERMQQVYQQVTQNSKIQQEMRIEMANLLSEKLEKIGLPQSTKGISKKTLSDKLSIMKKERASKSKRFPNFEQQRQHLNQFAESIARKKQEVEYLDKESFPTSQKAVEKTRANQGIVKVVQKQQSKTSAKKPLVVTKPPSPSSSRRQSSVNLQSPSTSLYQSTLPPKPQSSSTLSSSKQWPRELWKQDGEDDEKGKSDSWSDDDEDDFEDTPRESAQIRPKSSPPARPPPIKQSSLNKSQTRPHQSSAKSVSLPQLEQQRPKTAAGRTPPVPFPRTKPNARMVDMDDDDDDDDDSDNWPTFNGIRTAPAEASSSTAYPGYKPKREANVARLGNIIEDKLVNRQSVKLAGAVDLLNKNEAPKADDSDFSKVSSLEDDFIDNKLPNPRFSSTPASKGPIETDVSSNTYSTGVWGSSSKVASSISVSGSMGTNKQLTPSESEWDSD